MDCSPPGSSVHGNSPGKNTGVGYHALLQGVFPTQGLNPGLLHFGWILYWVTREAHLMIPLSSVAWSCPTLQPCGWQHSRLSCHHQLLELTQAHVIKSVMPSNRLILCHPLLILPSIFPSIGVFSNGSVLCIRWPKYWSFSFSPSKECSGLISLRMDWFDPFAVQGALKSLDTMI